MSYRSNSHHHPGERYLRASDGHPGDRHVERSPHHQSESGSAPVARANQRSMHGAQHAAPPRRTVAPSDYALVHGKRQVRLGPVAFWICVGTLVIMAGWTMVTATYFAFQEDVLTRLLARQSDMQHAYEDRIAEMRTQVDRVISRQLLDQEQFERKLDQIARRQATLESRAVTLSTLADPTATGSIRIPAREPGTAQPAPTGSGAALHPERGAKLEPHGSSPIAARFPGQAATGGLSGTLARLQDSLDRVAMRQSTTLANIEEAISSRARRMRNVLVELGLEKGKPLPDAVGGPFVPVRSVNDHDAFEHQLQRISLARAQMQRLNRTLVAVPVRQPLPGELDQSSGYGVRTDPFFGRPAMHTGLDLRGETGDPVRATAAGTVSQAGWNGGYGKMVEIDHGNGIATRYGHLSEIAVHEGQSIKIGQIIGRLGSTGRSTGPHLHYETRLEGDAVDPRKFLHAGAKLGLAQ